MIIFIQKLQKNENPILDSECQVCLKSFIYSDKENPFNLIELENKKFIIICNNCFLNNKDKYPYKKIIQFQDLIEHKSYIYPQIDNNENAQINIEKDISLINSYKFLFNYYIKYYNAIKDLSDNIPFSLKTKIEEKINHLNQDLIIKKKSLIFIQSLIVLL